MKPPDDVFAALERAADEANALIASCHERRECPTCHAPVGERCRALPRGYARRSWQTTFHGRVLKHSHEARWTPDVPRR